MTDARDDHGSGHGFFIIADNDFAKRLILDAPDKHAPFQCDAVVLKHLHGQHSAVGDRQVQHARVIAHRALSHNVGECRQMNQLHFPRGLEACAVRLDIVRDRGGREGQHLFRHRLRRFNNYRDGDRFHVNKPGPGHLDKFRRRLHTQVVIRHQGGRRGFAHAGLNPGIGLAGTFRGDRSRLYRRAKQQIPRHRANKKQHNSQPQVLMACLHSNVQGF